VKENALTTIHLTPEAENRLGIRTWKVELKDIPKILRIGGEVMVPPGQEVKVTAPAAGTVTGTVDGHFPAAGSFIKKGQEVMRLIVMPPEASIISAREDVRVKQKEYEVVLAEAERAEKLLANKAISEKTYEATQARLANAEASLNAARGRLNLYEGTDPDAAAEGLSVFILESPVNGVIQNINVTPQQTIAASTIMFEVSPVDRFWIRVAVYSGDLPKIDRSRKVSVSIMSDESGSIYADPVQGPLRSDAVSASSDLYYEIDNKTGIFRSGQKVSVTLILKSTGQGLIVPYSSIIYDMYGGNWIYVKSEPLVYTRTRIEVSHVSDTMAVLTRGVAPGDEVVYEGAAELYGTEFGGGK
jgi:RND family efflux transporter MFP subunit